jgi:hypothetical protein
MIGAQSLVSGRRRPGLRLPSRRRSTIDEVSMSMKMAAALTLGIWLAVFAAMARSPYMPLEQRLSEEQLRAVGLTPAQLELLNGMLREAEAKQGPAPAAEQVSGAEPQKMFIGLDDQPIKSRVRGQVGGWEPGTVFALDNGQQWKVLKGSMTLARPLDAPEIVVVPGIAGRWFLQVDEDMPKARVYRID